MLELICKDCDEEVEFYSYGDNKTCPFCRSYNNFKEKEFTDDSNFMDDKSISFLPVFKNIQLTQE